MHCSLGSISSTARPVVKGGSNLQALIIFSSCARVIIMPRKGEASVSINEMMNKVHPMSDVPKDVSATEVHELNMATSLLITHDT